MTTPPKDPISSNKGVWPFPQDRFSWLMAGLLLVVLLFIYYRAYYPRLEDAYNQTYTFTEPQPSTEADALAISLNVASPRYVSALSRQTLLLNVTNEATETVTIDVIPELKLENAQSFQYYVFAESPDDVAGTLKKGGFLRFANVPPGATVSRRLYFEVFGLNQATQDGQPAEPEKDDDSQIPTIRPSFKIRIGNGAFKSYSPDDPLIMTIDPTRAVVLGMLAFVLLPPWANGFVPLVAVFAVYLFGLPEAKRWLVPNKPKKTRFVAMMGWAALMVVTAWSFIAVLKELALAFLGDGGWRNWISVGASAIFFVALVGAAVFIDLRFIKSQESTTTDVRVAIEPSPQLDAIVAKLDKLSGIAKSLSKLSAIATSLDTLPAIAASLATLQEECCNDNNDDAGNVPAAALPIEPPPVAEPIIQPAAPQPAEPPHQPPAPPAESATSAPEVSPAQEQQAAPPLADQPAAPQPATEARPVHHFYYVRRPNKPTTRPAAPQPAEPPPQLPAPPTESATSAPVASPAQEQPAEQVAQPAKPKKTRRATEKKARPVPPVPPQLANDLPTHPDDAPPIQEPVTRPAEEGDVWTKSPPAAPDTGTQES